MSAGGITLDAFLDRHRSEGEMVPVDVALAIGLSMAKARSTTAILGHQGVECAGSTTSNPCSFGAALFRILTLAPISEDVDLATYRNDAPPSLVELMFEITASPSHLDWPEIVARLERISEASRGSQTEVDRYVRARAEPDDAKSARPAADDAILGGALDEEMNRLDLLMARAGQVLMLCLLVIAAVVGFRVSPTMGVWSAIVIVPTFLWFGFVASTLRRGGGGRWLPIVSTVVESLFPWAFLAIAYTTEGAAYTLSSWTAPMLIVFLIALSAVRLRPIQPVVIGAGAAVIFPILYFVLLRHELTAEQLQNPALDPAMQITRGASFAIAGLIAGGLAWGLRATIRRAERRQRRRDLFGKYRLIRELASGGMGTVHEALYCPEGGFERRVAIKTIHSHLAREEKFVTAFRREAELTARLAHPNIVQVFDFGQIEASYFLAMEFVEGVTLKELARFPLSPQLVAFIVGEILAGVSHAHDARNHDGSSLRIVHRDLSPSNVLISQNGEVKVADYGVAKALHDATHAITNTMAGSYAYMAPEQARNSRLDERTDLFAIGVLTWELLTGRRLFKRHEVAATLLAVLNDDVPPPSELRPKLHPAWNVVVGRATQRDPELRYPSATEMLAAVTHLLEHEGGACPEELAQRVAEATQARPSVPAARLSESARGT